LTAPPGAGARLVADAPSGGQAAECAASRGARRRASRSAERARRP
jgi:hypothetical protein